MNARPLTDTNDLVSSSVAGFVAGVLATIPMTISMLLMHRMLKAPERYPLPPRAITSRVLRRRHRSAFVVGGDDTTRLDILTVVMHFAYGGICGALFALGERFLNIPRTVKGVAFSLLVWTGSYLGWLPALRILSPATEHPPRRTALMIAAHVVWGASVGLLLDLYTRIWNSGPLGTDERYAPPDPGSARFQVT